MTPKEIRSEIKRLLDKYSDDQVRDFLRLVQLTITYNRMTGK